MTTFFIGRFQPFHNGHLKAIKWILKREKKVLIVIGSIDKSFIGKNLFSFSERKEMIKKTLLTKNIKNYKLYGVKDYSNDIVWARKVLRTTKVLPREAVVYTQNPWTKNCFKKIRVKVKSHPIFFNKLSGTQIREKISENKNWKNLVPKTVFNLLKRINREKRIKKKMNTKVAFQGEAGAFSEEAAFLYFGNSIETIGCKTLSDVFEVLEKDKVDYAIIPVENSIEGTVGKAYDLFLEYNLKPCGEVFHRIKHCLISFPGENLKSIKKVYSHPQALGQCQGFLESHKYETIPVYDTAGSIKMIKEKKLKNSAGIASERAAKIYGMKILKKDIETNHHNYTRFLILSKKELESTGNDKTSLMFSTKHLPGALYKTLRVFASRKINLTKIESRPIMGKPWEYNFILDFEGHQKDEKIRGILKSLRESTTFLKILGSYPKAPNH